MIAVARWCAPVVLGWTLASCGGGSSVTAANPVILGVDNTVQVFPAIPYSADANVLLDLYLPAQWRATDRRAAAVLIHGGGWSTGDRNEFAALAHWLAEQGMAAVAIDYRLAPSAKWPAQGLDAAQSVWWLRNHANQYGLDSDKIVSIGGSAGGHLAAMLGVTDLRDPQTGVSSQVQAIVSLWGPWNLTAPQTTDQRGMLSNLLASPADAQEASPQFKITASSPPTLLFHGTHDGVVPYQQSVEACAAFALVNARFCQLVSLPGQGHSLPSNLNLITDPLRQFLGAWRG